MLEGRVSTQKAEFQSQKVLEYRALLPRAELEAPEILEESAKYPTAEFSYPIVLEERLESPTAVFHLDCQGAAHPLPFTLRAPLPRAVFQIREPVNHLPIVTPLIIASAVVTRLPLAPERRNDSILFRLNTRSASSVVPMNCVSGLVPAFPVSPHPPPAASCHVALPEASEVRTYPEVAPDDTRSP